MTDDREATRIVYQEICKTHNGIADFRAKLLASLPIASGAGVFFLFDKLNGSERKLFIPIGLFGAVVTFGLFMYELRGIEDCTELRRRAMAMEDVLGVPEEARQFDQGSVSGGKGNLVDEIGAAWIIYMTVIAGWIFVGGVGVSSVSDGWPTWGKIVFGVVLGSVYLCVLVIALSTRVLRNRWGHDYWAERS